MPSRLSAFVIWALVAAAAAFWGLRLMVRPTVAPPGAVALNESVSMGGDLSRLFGAEDAPEQVAASPESSRFKLIGVMAAKPTGDDGATPGIALIAIDDKPARPFIAGSWVEDQLVLKSVGQRSASLGPAQGPATIVLEIPPLPPPATGSLTAAPGIEDVQADPPGSAESPQFAPRPGRPPPGVRPDR